MNKRLLAVGAVLFLLAFTVASTWPTKRKVYATYGVYGGGPPYFEGYAQVTPVPEPACFCIAGVLVLTAIIIRKYRKK